MIFGGIIRKFTHKFKEITIKNVEIIIERLNMFGVNASDL